MFSSITPLSLIFETYTLIYLEATSSDVSFNFFSLEH